MSCVAARKLARCRVTPVPGDATRLALGRRFDLVLAPASFVQIVGGQGARRSAAGGSSRTTWRRPAWPWSRSPTSTRSCASARRRRPGSTSTPMGGPSPAQQLAATEVEAGAQVIWQHTLPGGGTGPPALTIHR